MPPDLALSSTLIGSNYPCLELIFMVPKVFELLKFDCIFKHKHQLIFNFIHCLYTSNFKDAVHLNGQALDCNNMNP